MKGLRIFRTKGKDNSGAPARFPCLALCLLLTFAIFGIYWQVAGHQFLSYDDGMYVTENQAVLNGLTLGGIRWAFTNMCDANYLPFTLISHMLDIQLFGLDPAGHHLVNVALHALNAILLFAVLTGMTGSPLRSAAVAAIFAVHPLRVESVAWIAERKDVLSAFFWLLTMLAYNRFARHRSMVWYAAVLTFFTLGLLSKPMLVTLPFLLLLLDFWPLRRLKRVPNGATSGQREPVRVGTAILEKLPLILLAVVSSVLTIIVQRQGRAVDALEQQAVHDNLSNAVVSYIVYLKKIFWPSDLAVFYPYRDIPLWQTVLALVAISAVTAVALANLRRRPYLGVGWFWYLGTLVPVIGIIKFGAHAYADRYTYLPSIGITLMVVWGMSELGAGWRARRPLLGGALLLTVSACSVATFYQLRHWQNSITLFSHTLAVTTNNWLAHNNLATELMKWGKTAEAENHLQAAIRIKPDYASAYANLGGIYSARNERDRAIEAFRTAIRYDPQEKNARYKLGIELAYLGDLNGAYEEYQQILKRNPPQAEALLGQIRYSSRGR